jgi:hypothetical protein
MQKRENETMKILLANRKLEMESDGTNSRLGFCRHAKDDPKKPKELFFANTPLIMRIDI